MKTRIFTLLFIAAFLMAGCNLNSATKKPTSTPIQADQGQPVASTPTGTVTITPTIQTSNTLIPTVPTASPTITLSPTSSKAMVTPKTEAVNCRFGPGTNYLSVGGLKTGVTVPVLGQNGDGTWWQIQNPNNVFENCWISASATDVTGSMASVPVVPAPLSLVTLVIVNPSEAISVPGCVGPIQPIALNGVITVNGPVTVTYHFETEQGGALPGHNLTISKFGPVTVTENFTPSVVAGTYWIKLFVTAPTSLTAQATDTISCP